MSPAGVSLRRATSADLDAIVSLEREAATAPHWAPAAYAAMLDERGGEGAVRSQSVQLQRCIFVAERANCDTAPQRGEIVGFAVGSMPLQPEPLESQDGSAGGMHRSEAVAELESVAVAVNVRRSGVGRALCGAVLGWCREQGATAVALEVRAASSAAIALYTGLGFVAAGRRPRYYQDPEDDALILRLNLM